MAKSRFPRIIRRAATFAAAAYQHAVCGFPRCTQAQIDVRLDSCQACNYFDGTRCTHDDCGCNVNREGWLNKLAWADQSCPIGKWNAAKPESENEA
jgi:hypothetical protein